MFPGTFNMALGVGGDIIGDPYWDNVTLLLDGSNPTNNLKSGTATVTNPNSDVTTTTTDPGSHPYATDFLSFNSDVAKKLTIANDANVAFGNDDFTIEAWIYIAASESITTTATTWPVLFDARSTGSDSFILYIQNLGSGPKLVQNLGGDRIRSTTSLLVSTWYHVALTVENNIAKLFLDGVQEGGSWDSTTNSFTPAGDIELGFRSYASASISRFHGHMADIRITKGVARYTEHFPLPTESFPTRSGTPAPSAPGDEYWDNVDLLLGGSFADLSTEGNDFTSAGANVLSMTGPYGTTQGVLNFDGTNDYAVETTASGDFTFGTDDFTIEAWLKADVTPSGVTPGIIDYHYTLGVNGYNDYFVLHQMDGTLDYAFFANTVSTGNVGELVRVTVANTTDWNHVAITRVGSTVKMYLNGVLTDTSTDLVANMTSSRVNPKLWLGYQDLVSRYWNGKMTDVRITRGVARDIAADWTAGLYDSPPHKYK